MLLSYTCTSEKEIIRSATTTEVYPCSPLQARYLPGSCLTVSQHTLTRNSYQRASVDSGKSAGPPTWCLLQGSCKRNVRSRTLFSTYVDLTKAFDTVSKVEDHGQVRMPTEVYLHGAAIPRWHESTSSGQR